MTITIQELKTAIDMVLKVPNDSFDVVMSYYLSGTKEQLIETGSFGDLFKETI